MHITRNACMPDQNKQLEFTILFNHNIFSHVIFVQPIPKTLHPKLKRGVTKLLINVACHLLPHIVILYYIHMTCHVLPCILMYFIA